LSSLSKRQKQLRTDRDNWRADKAVFRSSQRSLGSAERRKAYADLQERKERFVSQVGSRLSSRIIHADRMTACDHSIDTAVTALNADIARIKMRLSHDQRRPAAQGSAEPHAALVENTDRNDVRSPPTVILKYPLALLPQQPFCLWFGSAECTSSLIYTDLM